MIDDAFTWATVRERLRAMPRGTQSSLQKALGINSSSDLTRRLSRGGEMSETLARRARQFFEGDIASQPMELPKRHHSGRTTLQVFGYAAGDDGDLVLLNTGDVIDEFILPAGIELGPAEHFVVRHTGPSMEPRYFPGDNHIVRRNQQPGYGKAALIELTSGHGAVKLYRGQRDGQLFGEQFNPAKIVSWPQTQVRALHTILFTL